MDAARLQWGSETGSRRRRRRHRQQDAGRHASMGLRDWVSEKARGRPSSSTPSPSFNGAPRLGLGEGTQACTAAPRRRARLQWGSETGSRRRPARPRTRPRGARQGFNGAPRLGLGEGLGRRALSRSPEVLQWGSETGSRRRPHGVVEGGAVLSASMGLRDWVSEKVSRRPDPGWRRWSGFNGAPRLGLGEGAQATYRVNKAARFNGAPRLGLGEGRSITAIRRALGALQWGSETGSRRRSMHTHKNAVLSTLQWGSETGSRRRDAKRRVDAGNIDLELQWGSETGSRRRGAGGHHRAPSGGASMGLRDWVSEKDGERWKRWARFGASMGLRDWVSEKDK